MDDYAAARRTMIDSQLRPQAVTDAAVLAAMAIVPRENFVPAATRALAYADRPVPLGSGRALLPPVALGRILSELAPRRGERALVVGGSTGYSAALLARMGVDVILLDSDETLAEAARDALSGVTILAGDLEAGHSAAAPFDLVLIDGAVETIPDALIAQLSATGRLGAVLIERGVARIAVGRRSGDGFGLRTVADAEATRLPGFARPREFTF